MRMLSLVLLVAACRATPDEDDDGYLASVDCDDLDPEVQHGALWFEDLDGDGHGSDVSVEACTAPNGFVADADDCDDASADVFSDAPETCDARDQDCDGVADNDPSDGDTWYEDADGDGFGGVNSVVSCEAPDGFVTDKTDCDDLDAEVSPDATELCNAIDDDCDGTTDPSSSADAPTWYPDGDADGFGAGTGVVACDVAGAAVEAGDCDDVDPAKNPHAIEWCDGIDNDCDGTPDDDDLVGEAWYADVDQDGFGDPDTRIVACGSPWHHVQLAEDCDDDDHDVNPDAIEVCNDVDDDCDSVIDPTTSADAVWWYTDADNDAFGAGAPTIACDRPGTAVAASGDCKDSDPLVHPNARDTCLDKTDRNCDGQMDGCDGCHRFEPVDVTTLHREYTVTYRGAVGTEVQDGRSPGPMRDGTTAFRFRTVLRAGTLRWDATSFATCDANGRLTQRESAGSWDAAPYGLQSFVATDSPGRVVLPDALTLGTGSTWNFTYNLVIRPASYSIETIPTTGTSTDAGVETITVPAGTFATWKITSIWTQDWTSTGRPIDRRTSTFWYAEGIGLVRERTVDTTSGAQVMSKDLAQYSGL